MPEQSCPQRLRNRRPSSSNHNLARLAVLVRTLLCLVLAVVQPFGFVVQAQEQEQTSSTYELYLAAIKNTGDPNHAPALEQITQVSMTPEEVFNLLPYLLAAKKEISRANRRNAKNALQILQIRIAERGVSIVPSLVELLASKDARVHGWAGQALLRIGEVAIPDLNKAVTDPDSRVQKSAMFILGENGPKAEKAIPNLQRIIAGDYPKYLQIDAAIAIAKISSDTSVISLLHEGLGDPDYAERVRRSADALAGFGIKAYDEYSTLVELLKTTHDPRVRGSVARALVKVEAPADRVATQLVSALQSEREYFFEHVIQLSRLNPDKQPDKVDEMFELIEASGGSRNSIAEALITFRIEIKRWRPQLIDLLQDPEQTLKTVEEDYDCRFDWGSFIAAKLPQLGSSAVPELVSILKAERSDRVRRFVVQTLGAIGLNAKEAVPGLIAALKDAKNADIRQELIEALGDIGGAAPEEVLPVLADAVESHLLDLGVHRVAAKAIKRVAIALEEGHATSHIALLDRTYQKMQRDDPVIAETAEDVGRSITHLRNSFQVPLTPSWVSTHKKILALAATPPVFLLLCLLMLWLRPLWLLKINDALVEISDVRLPSWLGSVTVPVRYVLLVGFFRYHSRVLDAWVGARVDKVSKRFAEKSTVHEHSIHVPIPISLNNTVLPDAGAAHFRRVFDSEVGCLLINGEGGTGKTSFACRVAQWALSTRTETRLSQHLMLPILIEPDVTIQFYSEEAVLQFVQIQLRLAAGDAQPPRMDLVKNLLRQKRVLLVVDSLSEMKNDARLAIAASIANLPVNASVVTSRNYEALNGVAKDVVVMPRIEGNYLSDFLGSYLTHLHKRQLFDDEEFFEACRRLTLIVGGRDITVLLAKLYADHMVMSKECQFHEDAPQNIPELFLQYVNRVNRMAAIDSFDDATVQQVAKLVAWACVKDHFSPTTIDRKNIILNLGGGSDGESLILHLEDKLKIVRTVGVKKERLRFTLDPLAEYLACLHVVDVYKDDESRWQQLLDRIRANRVNDIRFFLLALQDCCTANADGQLPIAMAEELSKLSGWDQSLERQKQRTALVSRLTRDLKMLDREELFEIQQSLLLAPH